MDELRSAFELPIRIRYRPPGWLSVSIGLLHLAAVICVIHSAIYLLLKIGLVSILSYSLSKELKGHFTLRKKRISILILNNKDQWKVINDGQDPLKVELFSASVFTPDLVILRFKDGQSKKYVYILTGGLVDEDTMRRLRVRLFNPISPNFRKNQ